MVTILILLLTPLIGVCITLKGVEFGPREEKWELESVVLGELMETDDFVDENWEEGLEKIVEVNLSVESF